MKNTLGFFVFIFFAQITFGQLIKGNIVDKSTNQPLLGASVYFDGSSIGTMTNVNGYFELDRSGQENAKIVFSYIGYNTITKNTQEVQHQILIELTPKIEQLNEVVLTSDPFTRKQKLEIFRKEFLGESSAAAGSVILNEDDIQIFFNTSDNTLTALSKKPIVIKNEYLGYKVKFDLQNFKITFREQSLARLGNIKYTLINGYSHFTEISEMNKRKIAQRRARSYLASPTHLMQTLWKNNFASEQFTFLRDGKKIEPDGLFVASGQSDLSLKKFHVEKGKLSIKYSGKHRYYSTLDVKNDTYLTVDPAGNYKPYQNLLFGRYMAEIRVANMLPSDYSMPTDPYMSDTKLMVKEDVSENVFPKGDSKDYVSICWDTSISMLDRDLEKDFSVLQDIFDTNRNTEVQVLSFALKVKEKEFSVTNGNWDAIKEYLGKLQYDGAVKYANLENRTRHPNIYIFTNGNRTFENDVLFLRKGSTLVNSSPNRNEDFLNQAALFRGNNLIDFAAEPTEVTIDKGVVNEPPGDWKNIKGTVFVDNKRTANLKVMVKGASTSSLTDDDGDFSIDGNKEDKLLIYSGNNTLLKEVVIVRETGMKIFIDNDLTELEEVVVTEQKKEERMVSTAHGLKDENAVGYGVITLSDDVVNPTHRRVGDALVGKVAGLNIHNTNSWHWQGLGSATIRGVYSFFNKKAVLVVIDGIPQERGYEEHIFNFDYLNPEIIEDITVLKSLASTNKYGNLGANGAILITTKMAKYAKEDSENIDLAKIEGNIYIEKQGELTKSNTSPFLKALRKSESEKEAYEIYLSLRSINANNTTFYLDAFSYFKNTNPELASTIISNLLVLYPENITVLRGVVLSLASIDYNENALKTNDKIIRLSPKNAQAHFDRAVLLRKLGLYQGALNQLLTMIKKDRHEMLDISGIFKSLERELRNLVLSHRNKLDISKVDPKYFNNVKLDTRLIFEWNNPEAEFEIQIVSPEKRYFNWEHTNLSDSERIRKEITQGFAMEEFELYGDEKGQWLINTTYLGETVDPSDTPLVLKCTIIRDFGTVAQSQYDELFYFNTPNQKKKIASLMVD